MGTNFYMMTKSKKLVEKHFPYEYEIVDTPYFGYEIHIGKRSCGYAFENDCGKLEKVDCYYQAHANIETIARDVLFQYKQYKKKENEEDV